MMPKLKKTIFNLLFFIILHAAQAQNITLTNIGSLTNTLSESSGVTFIAPNRIYTHDDSGGNDEIYELDTLRNLIRTINIFNASNNDWEDITRDDFNNIYIGDFGNNDNDRTNLRIYKIPNPSSFSGTAVTAQLIEFNYPDQTLFPPFPSKKNFDAEAFVWYNDSLFIFTKNRTSPFNGYCKMYKIPASPGNYTANLCDSIFLCNNNQSDCWVTSAAISDDKSHLALLNDEKVWWFSCYNGSAFFKGSKATANISSNTQKEGISFKNNHQVFITDEFSVSNGSGGNLYQADFSAYLDMPYINIIPDSVICDNCSLSVDSFIGAISWDNGLFGPSITPTYTGWYKASSKSLNNCIVTDSVYVSYLQSLNETKFQSMSVAICHADRNSISGFLNNIAEKECLIQLTDLSGKLISGTSIAIAQHQQPFSMKLNISNGLYLLHIYTKEGLKTLKVSIAY